MSRITDILKRIPQHYLLGKPLPDQTKPFKFPDGSVITGLTDRDVTILGLLTSDPRPLASSIRDALQPLFPKGQDIDLSQLMSNLGERFDRRGLPWEIKSFHDKGREGLHYILIPKKSEGIPHPFKSGDFIDTEAATRWRTKLKPVSRRQQELWEDQAVIEKRKTALNLAQTILTTTAYKQKGATIGGNLLNFLRAALPSSSPGRPANFGLLALNDPRVEQLTKEEAFILFDELMTSTQETIELYWNKNEADVGEREKNIIRALVEIKKMPSLTPEAIINSVITHFKPKTNPL